MLSLYAWAVLLVIPACAFAETHRFLAIPPTRQRVVESSNFTVNCTTNDANATTEVYFRQLGGKRQIPWKKIPDSTAVKTAPQVYQIINVKREYDGRFRCRAWRKVNGTNEEIIWPKNAGRVMILRKGQKPIKNKKNIKVVKKWKKVKKGNKKRPWNKKPENKKRPGNKQHKNKKPVKKGKSKRPTKGGKKKNKPKKPAQKKKSLVASLKTPRTTVIASDGKKYTLKCIVRFTSRQSQVTVAWYKDGKKITMPYPSHLNVVKSNKNIKEMTLLKIKAFQKARDAGRYECRATDKNGMVLKSATVAVQSKI